jgi:hypothetical protein
MTKRTTYLIMSVLLPAALCVAAMGKTIYVDDDAAGANDGSSWADVYVYLQDALTDANSAEKPVEIRVAQGVYRPNGGLVAIPEFDWRTTTFQLINGVTLKGGYAGFGKPDPEARDIELYETILSGDLNDDDEPNFTNNSENSYHVVTGSGTNATAVLDGFTVHAGNANGSNLNNKNKGGGMYCQLGRPTLVNCTFSENWAFEGGGMCNMDNSSPTLTNCMFSGNSGGGGMCNVVNSSPILINCTFNGNWADMGGGMNNWVSSSPTLTNCTFTGNSSGWGGGGIYNDSSDPILTNCTFSGNSPSISGGGMHNSSSSPTLTECTFIGNSASGEGGGMYNFYGSPTLTNCMFSSNSANYGGGMANDYSNPTVVHCTFSGNSAWEGGGMLNDLSNPTLTNCVFIGNSADWSWGGGMHNSSSSPTLTECTFIGNSAGWEGGGMSGGSPTLTNCTFSGNSADRGGGMSGGSPTLTNCTFIGNSADRGGGISSVSPTLTNCIIWGNAPDQIDHYAHVSYSNVQGGWHGEGNIDVDPLFAEPGYWADVNDTNIVVEPNAPNAVWVDGDYHLKSQYGRWDANSESWVIDDVTSPCVDAGDRLLQRELESYYLMSISLPT